MGADRRGIERAEARASKGVKTPARGLIGQPADPPSLKEVTLPKTKTASSITANPHTWLDLNPDDKHAADHFMFGVLERNYNGRLNSATEFATVKLQPVPPVIGGPLITAERAEVLLPADADDRFGDPFVLAAEVDRMAVAGKPALLCYVTLYYPQATRLHHAWHDARSFAERLADDHEVATIVALHAPHRAGSSNPVHAHLLIVPRVLNALGLGKYQHLFCFARGQKELARLWDEHRRT